HVLHAEHLRRAQAGVDLALELAGGAVHGLNIDHAEAVIDRYPAALVLGQVVVGVGLADGEGLPQAATPVIRHGTRDGEGLRIHVVGALGQRVAAVDRFGVDLVDLAQLPGDVGETATLATEGHDLIA